MLIDFIPNRHVEPAQVLGPRERCFIESSVIGYSFFKSTTLNASSYPL
jgi:hypothetical protein